MGTQSGTNLLIRENKMTKLYLVKSECEREDVGDVIVDLEKVFTFRIFQSDGKIILAMDYTNKDRVAARFSTVETAKKELKNIFNVLGDDTSIVDELVVTIRDSQKMEDKLIKLKALMEELKS